MVWNQDELVIYTLLIVVKGLEFSRLSVPVKNCLFILIVNLCFFENCIIYSIN